MSLFEYRPNGAETNDHSATYLYADIKGTKEMCSLQQEVEHTTINVHDKT